MKNLAVPFVCVLGVFCFASAALAADPGRLPGLQGGDERTRFEISPHYSSELGFSLAGAFGTYLGEAAALGVLVEYGQDKREYLANVGFQLQDSLSLIGTVGMLEEHDVFTPGAGREGVQQMEYGVSLKGTRQAGLFSGFELNGLLADADADSSSVETGRLYGVEFLADVSPSAATQLKLGGGYEWLDWEGSSQDERGFGFRAQASQQLGDGLSLQLNAKLGASEAVYGGGLAYDLSDGGPNSSVLGLQYSHVDGRSGIKDYERLALSWTVGFGGGRKGPDADVQVQPAASLPGPASPGLLGEVMTRPAYLPQRVLARSAAASCTLLPEVTMDFGNNYPDDGTYPGSYDWINIARSAFTTEQLAGIDAMGPGDFVVWSGADPASLTLYQPAYAPQLAFNSTDGDNLYFQFSSDDSATNSQNLFRPNDYVKIRFNIPGGCFEVIDQYIE